MSEVSPNINQSQVNSHRYKWLRQHGMPQPDHPHRAVPMRVLVVDDSALIRRAITQMVERAQGLELAGVARDGNEALTAAEELQPDVITLDVEMPGLDGLTALRYIRRKCDAQVLMLSSMTTEGSHAALQAMRSGAADILAKDRPGYSAAIAKIEPDLIQKIKTIGSRNRDGSVKKTVSQRSQLPQLKARQFDVVCIGASTGGPPVIETLVSALPASFPAPVVIAQHMPVIFTASMAERLDRRSSLQVVHASDGVSLEPQHVYIAPGGQHTHIVSGQPGRLKLEVNNDPSDAPYRPSVDALFHSAAETTRQRTLAIILTGMGCDGLEGAKVLHQKNATLLAQSGETCVVYGMPRGVIEQNLAIADCSPEQLANVLKHMQ
jgi:two-component system chemotaxis response regulator CheB